MKTAILTGTFVVFSLVSYASAIVNGQFQNFYPYYDWRLGNIFATNCSKEYNDILERPRIGGYWLVSCALEYISEVKKAEMAACSVILGLLPVAMQLTGPRLIDIWILALRRPGLAFLVTLGSPCAPFDHDKTGLEQDRSSNEKPLWPEYLRKPAFWVKGLISVLEYGLVGTAVANCWYQAYQLTFQAIALVSTLLGTFGDTMEAVSPILWIFLSVPIHIIGICSLLLKRRISKEESLPAYTCRQPKFSVSRTAKKIKDLIICELTPCAYQRCSPVAKEVRPSYRLLVLDWVVRLCLYAQVIMGIIVLSTVMFVSLWDTLEIVGRFLVGSIVCRMVLEFEIYCHDEISGVVTCL